MPVQKLTNKTVENAKPQTDGRVVIWDSIIGNDTTLPGSFGLRITDKGAKTWVVMYRVENGQSVGKRRQRFLTLGRYPAIPLALARERAREALKKAGRNIDPIEEEKSVKRARANEKTVNQAVTEFIERYAKRENQSWREVRRVFQVYVLPYWADRRLQEISPADVHEILDRLVDANHPYMANRLLAHVRKFFSWCKERHWLTEIPTEEIKDIVEGLELIYKMELMTEMGLELDNKKDDFLVTKMLTNAVKWYQDKNPEKVTQFREKLKNYLTLLKELNIKDEFLDPARQKKRGWNRTKTILFLIAGFPLFTWGILTNYPPYKLPRLIVKWFHDFQVEEASWKMMYGMVFFIVYYGFGIGIVWYLTRDLLWVGIFTISLIPSGNFALYYSKSINKYRQHVKFLSIFYQKRSIIFQIIEERMTIMRFLKNAKDEYIESVQLEA